MFQSLTVKYHCKSTLILKWLERKNVVINSYDQFHSFCTSLLQFTIFHITTLEITGSSRYPFQLNSLLLHFSNLTSVTFQVDYNDDFQSLTILYLKLEEVGQWNRNYEGFEKRQEHSLHKILNNLQNIKSIDVALLKFDIEERKKYSNIIKLGYLNFDCIDIMKLQKLFPNLTELKLYQTKETNDSSTLYIPRDKNCVFTQLQTIEIYGSNLKNELLSFILAMKNLKTLKFYQYTPFTDNFYTLNMVNTLQFLHLIEDGECYSENKRNIDSFIGKVAMNCVNLRQLEFKTSGFITNFGLNALITYSLLLEKLTISYLIDLLEQNKHWNILTHRLHYLEISIANKTQYKYSDMFDQLNIRNGIYILLNIPNENEVLSKLSLLNKKYQYIHFDISHDWIDD